MAYNALLSSLLGLQANVFDAPELHDVFLEVRPIFEEAFKGGRAIVCRVDGAQDSVIRNAPICSSQFFVSRCIRNCKESVTKAAADQGPALASQCISAGWTKAREKMNEVCWVQDSPPRAYELSKTPRASGPSTTPSVLKTLHCSVAPANLKQTCVAVATAA